MLQMARKANALGRDGEMRLNETERSLLDRPLPNDASKITSYILTIPA